MNIVFLCPPAGVINGGTKYIYRMAKVLADAGLKIGMYEPEGKRPDFFESDIPVLGPGSLNGDPNQVFVVPEDQDQLLASVIDWPQRKVVYSQNQFYGAKSIGEAASYADYGVSHILCSSQTILDHARLRHPKVKAHLIPCSIDRNLFTPLAKKKAIAFMPRKRSIEALYLQDMFRYLHPDCRDWVWSPIRGETEAEVARLMGEALVFLSLGRLEGFGLTPLEAMAAGCVVAGFTGLGGREYASDSNGFWADEDDFPSCLMKLRMAVNLATVSLTEGERAENVRLYHESCGQTLDRYTPRMFCEAVLKTWTEIFSEKVL